MTIHFSFELLGSFRTPRISEVLPRKLALSSRQLELISQALSALIREPFHLFVFLVLSQLFQSLF